MTSTLEMKAAGSFKISVSICQPTWHQIPWDHLFLFLFPFFGDDTVPWWLLCQHWKNWLSHLPAEMTKQGYGRNIYNSTPWGNGEICTQTGIFVAHMEAQQNFLFLFRVNFLKFLMKLGCETDGWNNKKQNSNIFPTSTHSAIRLPQAAVQSFLLEEGWHQVLGIIILHNTISLPKTAYMTHSVFYPASHNSDVCTKWGYTVEMIHNRGGI
jgi:hypothetical protein